MGQDRKLYMVLGENPKQKDHSEDRGVDGRMGLEWILWRFSGGRSGFSWLRIENVGGLL
jgi:hypothetical protein